MSELTLYLGSKNYSSWSMRAWLVASRSGVRFDETVFNIEDPASRDRIARHSPTRLVPALRHGELQLHDSLAISEYLAELRPEARLWPVSRDARAVARSVVAEMHSGFPNLRSRMPLNVRARTTLRRIEPALQAELDRVAGLWRGCRERFGSGGPLLFGADLTIADAFYAPVASRFLTYGVKMDSGSQAYMDALWSMPEVEEWCAAAQTESWTNPEYDALL